MNPEALRSVNPPKIDIKKAALELGNGSIIFPDQESAVQYGIKTCKNSVATDKPIERAVGITGNRVIYKLDGDGKSVGMPCSTEVVVHSHPDTYEKGCTTAMSSGDYMTFADDPKMTTLYAVNSNGEYYKMTKTPGFDFDKLNASDLFGEFNTCMDRALFGHSEAPAEQRECLEKCIESKDGEKYVSEFLSKYVKPVTSDMKKIPKMLVDKTHEFWVKFGDRFGVKIDTNFSNFTKPEKC